MSHLRSHGKILDETIGEIGRPMPPATPHHNQPPPAMLAYNRFIVTIYAGAGLVGLAIMVVFQSAP